MEKPMTPLAFACLLFLVNNLDLVRAWAQPPEGTHPMYVIRDTDIAQHLTWMNGLRDRWLLPDFHAPVVTSPGLFSPLMLLLGRIAGTGLDAGLVYTVAQFLVYIVGGYALFACARVFATSRRHVYAVILCTLCVLPLGDFVRFVKIVMGGNLESPIGVLERDGFILQGPLTLSVGTVSVLLSLALVGAYVSSGRRAFLLGAGLVTGVSALFHPFEVIVIVAGATSALMCLRWPRISLAFKEALVIGAPGAAALSIYAYLSLRMEWMAQLTRMNQPAPLNPARLLYRLGLPAIVALSVLVIGRMRQPLDIVLQCWFAATLIAMFLPKIPFRIHLQDGFAVVTALLIVRQFSTHPSLRAWVARRPRLALAVGGAVVAASLTVQIVHRYVTFRNGNRFSGAVARDEEVLTINWLRQHGRAEELVLAPPDSAGWIATVPIHSFASHWLFSFDYPAQASLAEAFYDGRMGANESNDFLRRYGINYVVVPVKSSVQQILDERHKVAQLVTWALYYFPENRMPTYAPIRSPR